MTTNDKVLVPRELAAFKPLADFAHDHASHVFYSDPQAAEKLRQLALEMWAMLAAAPQPAEDGLPELPFSPYLVSEWSGPEMVDRTTWTTYTADQMLTFRAEGIAYAQQRSAAVVVDEAAIERARTAYAKVKRYYTGDFPEGSIRSIVDINRNDDAAWTAALTSALNREEG